MTAQSHDKMTGVTNSRPAAWVSFIDTTWGYIIRSDTEVANRAALIERVCAVTGLTFLVAACGQWLIPEAQAAVLFPGPQRVISTLGLVMPALLFLWISDRGMTREVQVDGIKKCIRQTVVNRRGKTRILRAVPFDKIASAYVKKNGAGAMAQLFLRLAGQNKVIHVASGREPTLRVLHERLSQEIRPVRTKVEGWERKGRRLKPVAA